MEISNKFKDAVREKDIVKIRVMLKNGLLIDTTFRVFESMKLYAESQNVNFWAVPQQPVNKKIESSWSKSLLDEELAILIRDFTEERLEYVKLLIRYLYAAEQIAETKNISNSPYRSINQKYAPVKRGKKDNRPYYNVLERKAKFIQRIINESTRVKAWKKEDIRNILKYANEIEAACVEILKEE